MLKQAIDSVSDCVYNIPNLLSFKVLKHTRESCQTQKSVQNNQKDWFAHFSYNLEQS